MVRFRVVKASHLLLALAILVLAIVAAAILVDCMQDAPQSNVRTAEVIEVVEAEVLQTFASAHMPVSRFRVEVIPDPSASPVPADAKRILIYHTHTHEAYAQVEDDPYIALEAWRTLDTEHSVVHLGNLLAEELRGHGYIVVHDRTDHEQQDINSAYQRSLETLRAYTEDFDLTIDLHRDAYAEGLSPFLECDGERWAQLMLLVGRGDNRPEGERPDYEGNLYFAQKLTRSINVLQPGLCRNVTVKSGRYNQHIGRKAILVEVGHNLNTLEQAAASIPVLAEAIDEVLREETIL